MTSPSLILRLAALWLTLLTAQVDALAASRTPLAQIEHIAASGAPGLALALLDEQQPALKTDLGGWFRFERGRIGILARWEQWDTARQRLAGLDAELPAKLRRWARGQRAGLWLEEGRAKAALADLRELIWRYGEQAEAAELALWRRLVIRAYLLDDQVEDARIALRRYQQDFPAQQAEWAQLRAEVWLRAGHPQRVLQLSAAEREALPGTLLLLARLQAGEVPPGKAYTAARARAMNSANSARLRADYWRVAAAAARQRESVPLIAHSLEQALLLGGVRRAEDALPIADADGLWQAWLDYGQAAANRAQLLSGDEAGWLAAVKRATEDNTPVKARALLALLGEQGLKAPLRERALQLLAERIAAIPEHGPRLLLVLFLDPQRFAQLASIPAGVRQMLVDEALRRENIQLASRLLASLEQRPEGSDAFAWQLRRARVLVMGGDADAAVAALEQLLADDEPLSAEQIDRLLQVVFDLQAVEAHAQAIAMMAQLQPKLATPRQQRELYFWQADSRAALGQHSEAAWLYLRSATLLETGGRDQWGQSARYRAAEVLAKAGLAGDARRLYAKLLEETDKPERQAVLRNRIQQLWLTPRAAGDVSGEIASE